MASFEKLDPISQRFGERLLAAHPDWAPYVTTHDREAGLQYLEVRVPPPSEADLSEPLWISTEDEEVTVGMDSSHRHFSTFIDGDDTFQWALDHIEDLLAERKVVYAWFDADRIRLGGELDTARPFRFQSGGFRGRVRSWRGTYDQDIPPRLSWRQWLGLAGRGLGQAKVIQSAG